MHWNFFFTLSAVSVLTTVINIPPQYSGIFGSIILVGMIQLIYGLVWIVFKMVLLSAIEIFWNT